jgi:hypothetical protein
MYPFDTRNDCPDYRAQLPGHLDRERGLMPQAWQGGGARPADRIALLQVGQWDFSMVEAGLLVFCGLVLGPFGWPGLPQPYGGLLVLVALALLITLAAGWLLSQLTPLVLGLNE